MAGQQTVLLMSLFFPGFLVSAAKILTITSFGGSHCLLMNRASEILQDHGHQVINIIFDIPYISGLNKQKKSYQVINWAPPEEQRNKIQKQFELLVKETLHGRQEFQAILKLYEHYGTLCTHLLSRDDIMDSLKNENFDLLYFDAVDFCSFLVAEKIGKPFVVFLPVLANNVNFGLPSPLSYVPVCGSLLTDKMDFWGRVKNFLMSIDYSMRQKKILSQFDGTIREHFEEGSHPVLSQLFQKAELWFLSSDFALEFARPLFPNTIYVGGLLDKPVEPIPQDLENFISQFEDLGFVLVALGSIATMHQTTEIIKEMNSAFAYLPHGVLWTCKASHWPKDVRLAPNVKIVDWIPQNDLLAVPGFSVQRSQILDRSQNLCAHPSIRLFVTHGGLNSVNEAIQHGVPMVGITVFGDQPDNMVRVEAKNFGVSIQIQTLKAESFALTMKEVIEDKRYKSAAMAARAIRRSHPLTPAQRLVGWIDHILQTRGGAHLKPHVFQQPWHVQNLLDVLLFLLAFILGTLWLFKKVLRLLLRSLGGTRKEKES